MEQEATCRKTTTIGGVLIGIKIDIADGDDWIGLYFNDELVFQDHSIPAVTLLKLLNQEIVEFSEHFEVDLDWLFENGSFPKELEKVKRIRKLY